MRFSFLRLTTILAIAAMFGVACTPDDSIKDNESNSDERTAEPDGVEAVDLGLSVKWASFNIGATKPEGNGDYFAWGETEPYYEEGYAREDPQVHWKEGKSEGYAWASYKFCDYSSAVDDYYLNKYCNDASLGASGFKDNLTILEPDDDVAHVKWGGKWHMPTKEEFLELRYNCTWTKATINGVEGYKITGKKTGYENNYIFLPAAANRVFKSLSDYGSEGRYWTSSLCDGDRVSGCFSAYSIQFDSYRAVDEGINDRYVGNTVRPVCKSDSWEGINLTLDKDTLLLDVNSTIDPLSASFMSGNLNYGFLI